MRQAFSVFSSILRAFSASTPAGNTSCAFKLIAVNRVNPSERSTVPVASQARLFHRSLDTLAIARNVNIRQSAAAATVNVSGDHKFPGPSNSAGGADVNGVNPGDVSSI